MEWEDVLLELERYGAVLFTDDAQAKVKTLLDRLDILLSKHGLDEGLDLTREIRGVLFEQV